ncbi:MAG: exo-alpha-sialidase [Abditibacteriaceae bacterium]
MKLIAEAPTTIHAVRHAPRWFPALHQLADGTFLLNIETGYDAHFSPCGRWRSFDGAKTFLEEEENTPRCQITHSFSDGRFFDMDGYGFLDPKTEDTYHFYGAWSAPDAKGSSGHSAFYTGAHEKGEDWLGREDGGVLRDTFSIYAPSILPTPLNSMAHGYPHHPWWPLINKLYSPDVNSDEIMMGINITDTQQFDGRLLSVGYGPHKVDVNTTDRSSVFCFESRDDGHSWREIGVVARDNGDTPEGFNEATLTPLLNGRLHSVIRGGDILFQNWSEDGGKTWSTPAPISLVDSDIVPRMVWPRVAKLEDGTLVLAYGRPGKHLVFDPTGTGENWQGHLDLHALELETQAENGVPENQRLRGDTSVCTRYWDSGDYLSVVAISPREMLVTYDVQNFVEHPGNAPIAGVRMVRVRLDEE